MNNIKSFEDLKKAHEYYRQKLFLRTSSDGPNEDNLKREENDESVKNLAIEVSKKLILENATVNEKMLITKALTGTWEDVEKLKSGIGVANYLFGGFYNSLTAAYNQKINELFSTAFDSAFNAGGVRIENIRINYVNNDILKSECDADLVLGCMTYPITYSAQVTEDGGVYVYAQFKNQQ